MGSGLVHRQGVLASALLLNLLAVAPAAAQSGIVEGRVTDSTGGAIPGAVLTVDQTSLHATTTPEGRYVLRGVPTGTRTVRARAIGYTPAQRQVEVSGTVTLDFVLERPPVELAPIDVVVGSRARHTAAEELAVPVDVYTASDIAEQGTSETSQILQQLSPSVNFPRQSVTDANDIVRPFTLRGLSPDQTLVLVNGWRRHQMAVVNTFAYGMGAGSSGVDLNAIPGGAIDRIEVLRDGASAEYGSDAIAGVVNLVMKEGKFAPFLNTDAGAYVTGHGYPTDGATVDMNGGVGFRVGRGSLALFGEYQHRDPTNRAWPDSFLVDSRGISDSIDPTDGRILKKRNAIAQPNYHWGDGLEKDAMTFANFRLPLNESGTTEFYAFGGNSYRVGTGNGFWRYFDSARNWPELYPQGFLPAFHPRVYDYSGVAGVRTSAAGWAIDFGGSFGLNRFDYDLDHTNNASLGPCLDTPCAPGPDGILGTADDPGIPNQLTFFAGRLIRSEALGALNLS
ncbi:MAG TPA: TonB-dependent receptor plug domain-containing protein, partial [Gemmatimonadales bacterium]|nr:TonB-dependent receptor plug domain-containing protein [Gemmatimonadales bacterium]